MTENNYKEESLEGLRQYLQHLGERFKISENDVAKLMGYTLVEYKEFMLQRQWSVEKKRRSAILLAMELYLDGLYRNNENTIGWFKRKNPNMKNCSPLELLIEGSNENLELVERYVLKLCGHE